MRPLRRALPAGLALFMASLSVVASEAAEKGTALPARVRRIVLHVPGGPSYHRPARRFTFFSPEETLRLWKPRGGAHWIVGTDGSLWPRHAGPGEPASLRPPVDRTADAAWRRRLALEAAPVYSHLHLGNSSSVGIEVSHTGRSDHPFPEVQIRSLTWLLQTLLEMSGGRLTPASITGHKDLDRRPAFLSRRCQRAGCPIYVDREGRPLPRRVDPPESLFRSLESAGLAIPRPEGAGDADLIRAEALPATSRARVAVR